MTPSPSIVFSLMPKSSARWVLNLSSSMKLPGSSKSSMRSRAVSLPSWCCLSMRSCPPPSSACASREASLSRAESPESRSARFAEEIPPAGSGGSAGLSASFMAAHRTASERACASVLEAHRARLAGALAGPPALVVEEPALALEAVRVAAQRAALGDDAVARDGERDGVRAVGRADRAWARAQLARQVGVRARLAGGDLFQERPD